MGHDISSFASAARAPMSTHGVKQTSLGARNMSAYDPKRTHPDAVHCKACGEVLNIPNDGLGD